MKLKEINRTAIQSWSPAQHHPIYLATGTSAQQLDASFSTNASLEFFELDLTEPTLDMKSCGAFSSSHRYHKLVWGPYGMDSQGNPSGVLIAGGENGNVILYDPAKIMSGASDVIITESNRHTGPVRALDVNPFQTNLVASGGNESEIYIWDMNNFGSPMTPGPKTQPLEDISCVAWNRQVQHILASASPSGRASVWDLRKNDLILKVSDHSNRMHCSGLAWNPEVATQMVISSEDDRMPVIQMWDLRFATSPLKILENHTRGVLSIAWSLADPELLLSCGKDNRILCWNPNTGEVLYELPTSSQWCFDIQWCPRNPAVLSAASFDGHIDIYSIMGGSNTAQSQRQADQISTSFDNMDPFGTGQTLPPLQLPQSTAPRPTTFTPLKKPPKWIRRPVGASFAFGGKLVSLENLKPNPQQPQQPPSHVVHVSQVVTETDFLNRSDQLQATLSAGSFVGFCQEKIDASGNEFEKTVWSFLKANFESDIRSKYLELLGYNKEELALKISAALEEKPAELPQILAPVEEIPVEPPQVELPPAIPDLSLLPPADNPEAAFDMIAAANIQPPAAMLALDPTPAAILDPNLNTPPPAAFFDTPYPESTEETAAGIEAVEEETAALEPEVDLAGELEENVDQIINEEPAAMEEEDIPLEEVELPADIVQPIPDLSFLPPADNPEAAFDMIAAANIQPPAAMLALDPTPAAILDPNLNTPPPAAFFDTAFPEPTEEKAAGIEAVEEEADVVDLVETVDQTLSDWPSMDEEIDLEEEAPAPVVEEPIPAEISAPVEKPIEELAPPAPIVSQTLTPDLTPPAPAALTPPAPVVTEALAPAVVPSQTLAPVPAPDPSPVFTPAPPAPTPANTEGVSLSISKDVDGLITQALLTGDFEGAVELCLHDNRMADSIILAIAGGNELLEKTQKKYFTKTHSKITKLISAVVLKDWHDILKTCELQSWREALAAVMTYAQPQEFSSLCDLLGQRLEAAADAELQAQACLCYICAGNVEKLVSCWTRAQDGHGPLSLQDLVEKVVVLRRAVEQTQRSGPTAIGILLAEKMSQYANLLASQGSLATAIKYLPDNTNQVAIQQLRERLSRALGQQQQQPAVAPVAPVQTHSAPVQHQPQAPTQPQARPQPTHTQTQHLFTPIQPQPAMVPQPSMPAMVPQPTAAAPPQMPTPPTSAPAQQQYYQPVRAASTVTSWSNQTPTALPTAPLPPQAAAPPDQQQMEPMNPMYAMPPSLSAAGPPPPASSTPAYMISHQYQPYPQASQYPAGPGVPSPALYQPFQYPSSSTSTAAPQPPPLYPSSISAPVPPAEPPGFLSHYTQQQQQQPSSPVYPVQAPPSFSSTTSSSVYQAPPPFSPTSCPTSPVYPNAPLPSERRPSFQHGGPGSPVAYMPPAPLSGPQNGWNDPPALSRATKKKPAPQQYAPPAPIMSPLGAADPQPLPPQGHHGNQQGHHGNQGPYQQQTLSPTTMNPAAAMPPASMEGAPGAPTGEHIQPLQSIPAEKILKKPIPDEHLVLKNTFEGLIQKCLAVATDPQTKRKLDDANKRLEALYDKLREQTLSPAIVGGLHNIARSIESRSYTEGLNIHTHIVGSSNFSETSAFMPVLKVVLTQANKLGV